MKTLDQILQESNPDILENFQELKSKSSDSPEEVLIKSDLLSDDTLLKVLSEYYEVPVIREIRDEDIDFELVKELPISFSRKYRLIPLSKTNGTIKIAIAPPIDLYALDEVRSIFNCSIETHLTLNHTLYESINRVYEQGKEMSGDIDDEAIGITESELQEPKDLLDGHSTTQCHWQLTHGSWFPINPHGYFNKTT